MAVVVALVPVVLVPATSSAVTQDLTLWSDSPYYAYTFADETTGDPASVANPVHVYIPRDLSSYDDYPNDRYARVVIVDETDQKIAASCYSAATLCNKSVALESADATHEYRAYVVRYDSADTVTYPLPAGDIQTQSNSITMGWRPFRTSVKTTRFWGTGGDVEIEPRVSQTVYQSGYVLALYDTTDGGLPVISCDHGAGNQQSQTDLNCPSLSLSPSNGDPVNHTYVAAVVKRDTVWADVEPMAVSTPLTPGQPYAGPTASETQGGSTDSQHCAQPCDRDPVNTYTGDFYDSVTDLAIG